MTHIDHANVDCETALTQVVRVKLDPEVALSHNIPTPTDLVMVRGRRGGGSESRTSENLGIDAKGGLGAARIR